MGAGVVAQKLTFSNNISKLLDGLDLKNSGLLIFLHIDRGAAEVSM